MVLAEEEYGIKDTQILHAIRVHTTGEADMGLLDKILFVADYIEPNRCEAPRLEEIRKLAFQTLIGLLQRYCMIQSISLTQRVGQ